MTTHLIAALETVDKWFHAKGMRRAFGSTGTEPIKVIRAALSLAKEKP